MVPYFNGRNRAGERPAGIPVRTRTEPPALNRGKISHTLEERMFNVFAIAWIDVLPISIQNLRGDSFARQPAGFLPEWYTSGFT